MKKDIYELFNEVSIDEADFEEMEVTEIEKAKLKKSLKQSLQKKKKKWKKPVIGAAIVLCLSTTTFGLAFPTQASRVPIIGDIFRFLDNDRTGLYDHYKENANELNVMKESNGIKITVNDAVFDGKTVTLTYSIESERDLGEDLTAFDRLNVKGSGGASGSSGVTKVEKNKYVGLAKSTQIMKEQEAVNVNWNVQQIILNPETKPEKITGDWDFNFHLKATDSTFLNVNKSMKQKGLKVNIEKMMISPMSFTVYFSQDVSKELRKNWDVVDVDLEIKDDLGNVYAGEGNGGSGEADGSHMNWTKTFEKLDENATRLIVTPHVHLYNYGEGGIQVTRGEILENGEKREFTLESKNNNDVMRDDMQLDDMIIELKK